MVKQYPWRNDDGTPKMYKCKACGKEFQLTNKHYKDGVLTRVTCSRACMLKVTKHNYRAPWRNDDGTPIQYECKVCGKTFPLNTKSFKNGEQVVFTCSPKCSLIYRMRRKAPALGMRGCKARNYNLTLFHTPCYNISMSSDGMIHAAISTASIQHRNRTSSTRAVLNVCRCRERKDTITNRVIGKRNR